MRKTDCPLVCRCCRNRFHIKCANQTRDALQIQRQAGTWECEFCRTAAEHAQATAGEVREEAVPVKTGERLRELKLMQWNCDGLATKRDELEEVLKREKVQVVMLQETKLGQRDDTPRLDGYTAIRKDRSGSGTTGHRAGGLCTYVRDGLAHWEEPLTVGGVLEGQRTIIPLTGGRRARLLNLYASPVRGEEAGREWRTALRHLEGLPTGETTLWCGDLNAHHGLWDPFVDADGRGNDLVELMEQRSLITVNDGSATRYQRFEREDRPEDPGRSVPDVTIVTLEGSSEVRWSTLEELSSDHIPVVIKWSREARVSKSARRVELNMKKGDWRRYRELVEEGLEEVASEENIKRKLAKFTSLMIEAGEKVCPAKVIREHNIPWMTAEIKRLRRMRNSARRDMGRRRSEWVNICRELKEKTREAKRDTWRKHLEKISEERNTNRAWSVIKKLGGGKAADSGSKAMYYNGRWRTTPRAKADAFVREYAEISGRKTDRAIRREKVEVARELRGHGPRQEIERDFSMTELRRSLRALKSGKAPGPDGIRPEHLKNLPERAKELLLNIVKHSWREAWVPQEWREAVIVPILKKGKDSSKVGSYRPIALTSQLGKTVERLITTRLSWWLEEHQKISPYQAGFRAGRSTTDQCLRLSQHVSDGFQNKPPKRTLLTLFDYSRAFDTVRRTALLRKLLDKGVPHGFVRWVRAWLENRQARVRVDGALSRVRVFKQGLPQGAVLSPLLFISFLDDLLGVFEEDTLVSAYADDLALATCSQKKEEAKEKMQREVDKVVAWSRKSGLTLNTGKCETCLFTPSTAECKWTPDITIEDQPIQDTHNPKFLGITYDKMQTFNKHVQDTTTRMHSRMNLLNATGGADWGWSRGSLRQVYTATQRSIAEYASPAWAPWVSNSGMEDLEIAQRRAARRIAGTTMSTPAEAVLREAGLEEMKCRYRREAVCKYENWKHQEEGDVRREVVEREVRRRTKKQDWRENSRAVYEGIMRGMPEEPEDRRVGNPPPWRTGVPGRIVVTNTCKTDAPEAQKRAAMEALESAGEQDLTLFTDGSARGGVEDGGAGVAAYREGGWRTAGRDRQECCAAPTQRRRWR